MRPVEAWKVMLSCGGIAGSCGGETLVDGCDFVFFWGFFSGRRRVRV